MNVGRLLTSTATVTSVARTGTEDVYGVPAEATTSVDVACWLHQTRRTDDSIPVARGDETWELYVPAGTEIDTADRVTVDDVAYEVVGPPWVATNPRTRRAEFTVATVRRTA